MKRLQFRHHEDIFASRAEAMQYFADIADASKIASTEFGDSLYSEPMVAKYSDESGKSQVILAIGADSGKTMYHIIDTAKINMDLAENAAAISSEKERAMEAENSLSGMLQTEIERATAAEDELRETVVANVVKIESMAPSAENIREEYKLTNADGTTLGETIKVYKDSRLLGATFGFKGARTIESGEGGSFIITYDEEQREDSVEYLYIIYETTEGSIGFIGIDFENFLQESELKDGFDVTNHEITVKIKADDEFIGLDETGIFSKGIREAINEATGGLSTELSEKIDAEIDRSTKADEYISGITSAFSASVVDTFASLSGSLETEIDRATKAESALSQTIADNKIYSKDVLLEPTDSGTSLTIQTDEVTITKFASASTIYDTNVGVLGTLLAIKEVDPQDSAVQYRYELQDANGKMLGDPIKINAETSLYKVENGYVGDTIDPSTGEYDQRGSNPDDKALNFIYRLNDGTYHLVSINISEYFTDAHFGRGLNNQDGVISLLEGDGNEYLVIGEDSLAVVGVNAAINAAKTESAQKSDDVYSAATAYTNTRVEEARNYTDTKVADVTMSIDSLTNTLNEAIANVNNTLNTETQNRETADADILAQLRAETANRISAITNLQNVLEAKIQALDDKYLAVTNAIDTRLKVVEDICSNLIDFGKY